MNTAFRFRYAFRSLVRSGQRSTLGVLCIAFGVLCLVAMQLLAGTVRRSVVIDPRLAVGGDFRLARPGGVLDAAAHAQLEEWRREGYIRGLTVLSFTGATLVRPAQGGPMAFLSGAYGVDDAYPLLGRIEGLSRRTMARVLGTRGDVLVTRDVARRLRVGAGDSIVVGSLEEGVPVRVRVGGIIERLPSERSGQLIFGAATAPLLAAEPGAALVLTAPGVTAARFEAAGWSVRTPADAAREAARVAELFDAMLKGAGLLGLLVGALGVLNTLHVALARRTEELATLRTLGYTGRDLALLLGSEVLMLGTAGALLGGAAGSVVAARLAALLANVQGSMSITFRFDPGVVAGGIAVGLLLSVAAGMLAVARASSVRPAVLLRQADVPLDGSARRLVALLGAALCALFTAIASMIMGSLVQGLAVVALALVTGALLVGGLALVLRLVLRLPLPLGRFGGMARRNLGHRPLRSLVALGALAVGVFSIGFAAAALLSGRDELVARQAHGLGAGLVIAAPAAAAPAVRDALAAYGITAAPEPGADGAALRWRVDAPAGTALPVFAAEIARALPQALIISTSDIAELLARTIRTLFTFVAAVAALALLAGVVLIANAVGLGLLERRRELAMLKALGYSRSQVLRVVLLENGMLGAIGSGFGLLGTFTAIAITNTMLPQSSLRLHAPASLALLIIGITLAAGTALAVAWPAARVRPLLVLRGE